MGAVVKEDTTNWKRHVFPDIGMFGAVVLTNVPDGGHYMSFRASIAIADDTGIFNPRSGAGFAP